jgi:hypothetical protein
MAATNNWQQLAGVRFALGITEAGFAPGIAFYLSSWYVACFRNTVRRLTDKSGTGDTNLLDAMLSITLQFHAQERFQDSWPV